MVENTLTPCQDTAYCVFEVMLTGPTLFDWANNWVFASFHRVCWCTWFSSLYRVPLHMHRPPIRRKVKQLSGCIHACYCRSRAMLNLAVMMPINQWGVCLDPISVGLHSNQKWVFWQASFAPGECCSSHLDGWIVVVISVCLKNESMLIPFIMSIFLSIFSFPWYVLTSQDLFFVIATSLVKQIFGTIKTIKSDHYFLS